MPDSGYLKIHVGLHTHYQGSLTVELRHEEKQQSGMCTSEDSDQPGHTPSLTRAFATPKLIWVFAVY